MSRDRAAALTIITVVSISSGVAAQPLNGTYSVGAGQTYSTPQAAFSAALSNGVDGPVVFELLDGTYAPFSVGAIPGTSVANTVTLRPATGATPTIDGSSAGISITGATDITLEGLALSGTSGTADAITLNNVARVTLRGNTITWLTTNNQALYFVNAADTLVENNIVDHAASASWSYEAIYDTGLRTTFRGNNFTLLADNGLYYGSGDNVLFDGNTVTSTGGLSGGIEARGAAPQVTGNTFVGFAAYWNEVIYTRLPGARIVGNTIEQQDRRAAISVDGSNTLVQGNTIVYTSTSANDEAIAVSGGGAALTDVQIVGNHLRGAGSGYKAIELYYATDVLIANNTIHDFNIAIDVVTNATARVYNNTIVQRASSAMFDTSLTVRNNIIVNESATGLCFSALPAGFATADFNLYWLPNGARYAPNIYTLTDWRAAGQDVNGIVGDPLFVSTVPGSEDLALLDISPAQGRATPLPEVLTDALLTPRDAQFPDIGAFENTNPIPPRTPLAAGTYDVGPGRAYATLQAAADDLRRNGAAGGVTLRVHDDTYAPTLIGPIDGITGAAPLIVEAAPGASPMFTGSAAPALHAVGLSGLVLRGLTLVATDADAVRAIGVTASAIEDNLVAVTTSNAAVRGIASYGQVSITGNTVELSMLAGAADGSVGIYASGATEVSRNQVLLTSAAGAGHLGVVHTDFLGIARLDNNRVRASGAGATIGMSLLGTALQSNRTAAGNNIAGFDVANLSAAFRGTLIAHNNSLLRTTPGDLLVLGSSQVTADVYNTLFVHTGFQGAALTRNTGSLRLSNGNLFWVQNGANVAYESGYFSDLALWAAVTGRDPDSVQADPRVVNLSAGTEDLRLQVDSPARGRGLPLETAIRDLDGEEFVLSAPDIGADHYSCVGHADGAACDDSVACTLGDVCGSGVCVAGAPSDAVCDDGDACNGAETCDFAMDCQPGAPLCQDGDPCTDDLCSAGVCSFVFNEQTCEAAVYLERMWGNFQTGQIGTLLSQPFGVRLTNSNGSPVQGVVVTWTATQGGGDIVPRQSTTDPSGIAQATGLLGPLPGAASNLWTAHVDLSDGPTVDFTASASSPPPAELTPALATVQVSPASGDAPLTVNLDASLSVGGNGAAILSYTWDTGDGQVRTTSQPVLEHTFAAPGGYNVALEIQDVFGQRARAAAFVSVSSNSLLPPRARIVAEALTHSGSGLIYRFTCDCEDPDGTIIATLWDYGDGDITELADQQHAYVHPGSYRVRLVVEDNDGLLSTDSLEVSVSLGSLLPPSARIAAVPIDGEAPLRVALSAHAQDPDGQIAAVRWYLPTGATRDLPAIEQTFVLPGHFNVHLEVEDNDGLVARDQIVVRVRQGALLPPRIISTPSPDPVRVGDPYQYDADGQPTAQGSRIITWTLGRVVGSRTVNAPDGMQIDPLTGALTWTPGANTVGEQRVSLTARNDAGEDVQDFVVFVEPGAAVPAVSNPSKGCTCNTGAPPALLSCALLLLAGRARRLRSAR